MPLTLTLPAIDPDPAHPPETRPVEVYAWLEATLQRDPKEAARMIADALAAINVVAVRSARRLELADRFWAGAESLWPLLQAHFVRVSHPLTGDALDAAKASVALALELSTAYKRLLVREANRRVLFGGNRLLVNLLHRNLQATHRILVNSYMSYSPVPPRTWLDAHRMYAFARERDLHQRTVAGGPGAATPEGVYLQALLLALANPYGFGPGQLATVLGYVQEHAHWAKLTEVAPVHRMAKAVAIVPVGHDFPPFSASKGGSVEGSKIFLLAFDLAFQIQEQLRKLESGGEFPPAFGRDPESRQRYLLLLRRLLRQWAIPPARQFNRLPSRARVVMCSELAGVWQYSRGRHDAITAPLSRLPHLTQCEVINHTPVGYALRHADPRPGTLRIGELIGLRVEGRAGPQVAIVRWYRNAVQGGGFEFGCEILSDQPEAAVAAAEGGSDEKRVPVVVLPAEPVKAGREPTLPQVIVGAGLFGLDHGIALTRGNDTAFAVLTKLVEQGPGFEIYDFAVVS